MTTPNQAAKAALARRTRLITDTEAEIRAILLQAAQDVTALLAGQPTEYQQWRLPQLQAAIRRTLATFGGNAATAAEQGQSNAWREGQRLTDTVLQAYQVRIALPTIDVTQLQAMSAFLTDKVSGITIEAANQINTQLGLVVIGSQTPFDAIKRVQTILGEDTTRRAGTIVRTELARAYSTANQARMVQSSQHVPGLQKRWVKSGKLQPRLQHLLANGQTVAVDKPFLFYGGSVQLMYPHDPAAPASETINCGCVAVPVVPGWKSKVSA